MHVYILWKKESFHVQNKKCVASRSDGIRILVDRLWRRGVSKEKADIKLWLKDISPSTTLRTWFGHDPERWQKFKKRYFAELRTKHDVIGHYPTQWEEFKKKYLKDYDEHPHIIKQLKKSLPNIVVR